MTIRSPHQIGKKAEPLIVKIGDMKISDCPTVVVVTYALGSCMGIAAYDPSAKIGGILHFMLSEPTTPENQRSRPLAYGSLAIPAFFRTLFRAGAKKNRLIVKIAGGANMMKASGVFRIGEQNYELTRKLLDKNNIQIAAEDCGGIYGRTLRLLLADGACYVTNPRHREVEL